jgi:rhodanese-related sulfurtransferase
MYLRRLLLRQLRLTPGALQLEDPNKFVLRRKHLRLILNGIGIIAALVASFSLARHYLFVPVAANSVTVPRAPVGARVAVLGVDWGASESTAVIVLSTHCASCRVLAGFYQQLVRAAGRTGLRVLAVFPEPLLESRPYLSSIGLDIKEVYQSGALRQADFPGVLLVDSQGKVVASWFDKTLFPSENQGDIFARLGIGTVQESSSGEDGQLIDAKQLQRLLAGQPNAVILDTRTREDYRDAHIFGSLNIPPDELAARAPVELPEPSSTLLIVYCNHCEACEAKAKAKTEGTYVPYNCWQSTNRLKRLGFKGMQLVADAIDEISAVGIQVVSSHPK